MTDALVDEESVEQARERGLGQFGPGQVRELAQVQNAQHLIDIVAIDGQASVLTRRNRPPDRLIIVVEIDAYDFIVRHHDVID